MAKTIIPAAGLVGVLALREATSELQDTIRIIQDVLRKKVAHEHGQNDCWVDLVAIYPDRAIAQIAGRYYSYAYSIDENNVAVLQDAGA